MSYFKTNNRFQVLMEPQSEAKLKKPSEIQHNNFKMDKKNMRNNNNPFNTNFSNQHNEFRRQKECDKIKKIKEEEIKILTNEDNFPELKSSSKNIKNIDNSINYFNKLLNIKDPTILKKENSTENVDNKTNVPEGCLCIDFDKKSNSFIWTYGKNSIRGNLDFTIKNCDEKKEAFDAISRMTSLYRMRRNVYITKWGCDEYEKMFMFPNYDYEYFEKKDDDLYYDYKSDDNYDNSYDNSYENI